MGIIEVLALVFGLAGYISLVGRANDWHKSDIRQECYESRVVRKMASWQAPIPYPLRRSAYRLRLKKGDKNLCTGEVWNGRWWYKP